MPLSAGSRAVVMAFGTVSFVMADDERTVRIDITKELLARVDGPPPKSRADYFKLLQRYRPQFEQIASAKFDEGQYKPEVNVLVVSITDADLAD